MVSDPILSKPLQQTAQRCDQQGAGVQQLLAMPRGKAHQPLLTFRRQPNVNLPPVGRVAGALYQSALHQPVRQSNGAMMLDQQDSGQVSNGRAAGAIECPHGQEELVLLRLQSLGLRRLLAELQKTADLETEIGEG